MGEALHHDTQSDMLLTEIDAVAVEIPAYGERLLFPKITFSAFQMS
jgi:hypothetical protein